MSQKIKDIKGRVLAEGLIGHYVHGQSMTLGIVEIAAGSQLATHQHPHEQITYILQGELEMTIGEKTVTLSAGMYYIIPSNTLHGAVAYVDCTVMDVFSPVREDYK